MKYFNVVLLLCGLIKGYPQDIFLTAVPEWSKQAIWYQIFPERFWNGDEANDPTLEKVQTAWPFLRTPGWQIHPWTSDWYKLQSWELSTGQGFYTNAGARRYGGDLQGVIDRLPYLQDLGITAIYFNPLFESPSHHKYDASMYHHIDKNFGPHPSVDEQIWQKENPADPSTWQWTTADSLFLRLIQICHQNGIKVIIDGVFNHVGITFWAFQDVMTYQQNSAFREWFIIHQWDDPSTSDNEFAYQGWNGVRDLPEIQEDENGLMKEFADHIHAVVKRWMDPDGDGNPEDGIDGWRLDVAEKVHPNFWRMFRKWVKEINPDAYLVGEIWWEDWPNNKMFNAAPWLQGDMFDGVMNYRWGRAVLQFIADEKHKISVQAFVDSLSRIYSDYPQSAVYASQNVLGSHDMERLASQIVNSDRWIDHGGNPAQNPAFDVRKPTSDERLKQKLAVALQMTLPGAPMIYYGDEAGMWGGDDPDCRKPMIWPDLQYEPEAFHPFHQSRAVDNVEFDRELFMWYRQFIRLRRNHLALRVGAIQFIDVPDNPQLFGYKREFAGEELWVICNPFPVPAVVSMKDLPAGKIEFEDLVSAKRFSRTEEINLDPWQILILQTH